MINLKTTRRGKCLLFSAIGFFIVMLKIVCVSTSAQLTAGNTDLVYKSPDTNVVNLQQGVVNFYDRTGQVTQEKIPHLKTVKLVNSKIGKAVILPILKSKPIAKAVGWYKKSRISSVFIEQFAKEFSITLSDFVPPDGVSYKSFNDFFTRKLSKTGKLKRTPSSNPKILSSPADSKVFYLDNLGSRDNFWVKESEFNLPDFLGSSSLAEEFKDGSLLIFRLAPHDYHRFHAPLNMVIENETALGGHLESVNPASYAMKRKPLAKNKRIILECRNEKFGKFIVAPIGAMMVGKIVVSDKTNFSKGAYLGHFELGGSSLILIFKKGQIQTGTKFIKHSLKGLETQVMVGDDLGHKIGD